MPRLDEPERHIELPPHHGLHGVHHGTAEQKERFLPLMATGEKRGGICITEPNAGSDVQAIETRAVREGDDYVVNGSKSLITNGRHGNTFALVTKTDPAAAPPAGISIFIAEKGPGFNVVRDIPKLGYKGVDTCELSFDDYRASGGNLVGGEEGRGFYQIMSGLELGRINVAARCLGVARAALEEASATPSSAGPSASPSASTRASRSCWPTWPPASRRPT